MKKVLTLFILIIVGCTASSKLKSEMSEGEKLFKSKCRSCHILPSANEIKKEHWTKFLTKHGQRINLTDQEIETIANHLQNRNN